jgi:methylmalonyl-CoA/ethylmalonyl-CoA epimerase
MSNIKINHLAVVVEDIEQSLAFWCDGLGLSMGGDIEDVPTEEVKIAFLSLGESHIELIQPSTEESGITKYLAKRGQGMHHICLEVSDIEAKLAELSNKGYHLINETPRERDGKKYAFVHPKSTGGVLLELYEV